MKKYLLLAPLFLTASLALADNYKIIIDAGSSGSRVHVFQYDNTQAVPLIKDIFSESVKPGLSSFEKNPQDAGKSIQKLLDDAAQQLRDKQISTDGMEVYVFGTAGMRLLPDHAQAAIYRSVHDTIEDKNNHYGFHAGSTQTISGQMEGLYGWLDINYLAGTFSRKTAPLGSIDMGGASTQIAYVVSPNQQTDDTVTFTLADQTYTVFSKSFLGLGQDQARDRMTLAVNAATCYPSGYQVNTLLTGSFDFANCRSLYANIVAENNVAQQLLPFNKQTFLAYSGAYYTYNFLATDKDPSRAALEKRILSECTKSWDQLKKDYPQVADKYLSSYCSNAVYMDDLFYETYQLQHDQLQVVTKINDKDIDWTLGSLLFMVKK